MGFTNKKASRLKPSETLAVKARANELKAQGLNIIDFSTGEPDIDTPQHIKDAAEKALRDGKTKYTEVAGIKELRDAIASKLLRENGIKTDASGVIVTNGGKQALEALFEVILEAGDEVVVPAPYWVSYIPMIELSGGTPKVVKARPDNGFKLTPAELQAVITPKTKAVIINSPSNPTGAAYTKEELTALGEVIAKSNALVVSDEIYEKVVYGGFSFSSCVQAMPFLEGRIVTINGFSKAYSMTGWRVGYASGPKEIIAAMGRLQSQTTSNVCSIAQYASLAALQGSHDFIPKMIESFDRRINLAMSILAEAPGLKVVKKPEGAFYLFIRFAELASEHGGAETNSSANFVNYLLEKAGVAAVPGEAFGDDRAFRISVASADANIKTGCERIRDAVLALGR